MPSAPITTSGINSTTFGLFAHQRAFPEQDANDAADEPFELPEEAHRHTLWALRHKLLRVRPDEADIDRWTWQTVASALVHEFNYDTMEVTRLGEHFFVPMMGQPARRFATHLAPTSALMWNAPPHGSFQYDPAAGSLELWAELPIADHAVLAQLTRVSPLSPAERAAVQDVYIQPRRLLAHFAMLFDDFTEAQRRLIKDGDPEARWHWFRRQFTRAREHCGVIAAHLQEHVEAATSQRHPDRGEAAHLVLRQLFADENASTAPPPSWGNDSGAVPPVTWTPPANGGAFVALLGLAGTGLEGSFTPGHAVAWREIGDTMNVFGHVRDAENCPVSIVIPAMGLQLTPAQLAHVSIRNGLVMADVNDEWFGGAQGFDRSGMVFCASTMRARTMAPRPRDRRNHACTKLATFRGGSFCGAARRPGSCCVTIGMASRISTRRRNICAAARTRSRSN